MQKNFAWKLSLPKNRKKETILFNYEVNDHVYSKSKSVLLHR